MDTSSINELKSRANTIKTASQEGENTADRVGGLLYDMVDYDASQSTAITSLERQTSSMQEQIDDIIEGGGGGGGTSGQQKTFFLNISHAIVPTIPSVADYNVSDNTFVSGVNVWTSSNVNPLEGQDTYMIWSWFVGGLPQSTSGPVRIYDSSTGGSNGEDANETEWVYRRVSTKPTAAVLAQWTTDLANAKGTNGTGGKNYTSPDITPPDWNDNALGIDNVVKYEYASFRVSSIGSNGKRIWGDTGFNEPILWSAYGDKGVDGDGVEYIFYADQDGRIDGAINHPENWDDNTTGIWKDPNDHSKGRLTFQDNEFIAEDSDWVDDPIDLESSSYGQGSIEYVSIRRKRDGIWQSYSAPKPWTRYAKDGVVDGYTVDLSNENMPVGTDNSGNASDYHNSSLLQVFHNGTPLTYAGTASEGHFTYSIGSITRSDAPSQVVPVTSISAIKNGTIRAQIDVDIINVINFDNVNAYIPITVSLPNGTTREVNITLYGVATGEAGASIDLYTSCNVVRTNSSKTEISPSTMSIGVKIGKGDSVVTYFSGTGSDSAESKGYSFKYGYDDAETVSHQGVITLSGNHSTITVELYKDNHYIDGETLPYIADGANGRGVQSITPYYKATDTNSTPEITTSDQTNPNNTGWSQSLPYLFRKEHIIYTNGDTSWGTTELYKVWTTGETGKDGYSLIVNPPYAIFEEPIGQPQTQQDGTIVYPAGEIDPSGWSSNIQVLKGNDAQSLAIDTMSFNLGTADFDISSDDKTLTVFIEEITNTTATEGLLSFNVKYWNGSSYEFFFKVEIPVYINRVGSRIQTIVGDVETSIMSKTIYDGSGQAVTKFSTLGTYLRSSETNVSTLQSSVNTISNNVSVISQKADAINLSVSNGWLNYISNPLAINGTIGTVSGSYEIVEDSDMGEVYQISNNTGTNYQLTHTLIPNYTDLTGKQVTWFCIVKCTGTGDLNFGSGFETANNGNQHAALHIMKQQSGITVQSDLVNPEGYTYYDLSTRETGTVNLNNGWYLCWSSIKLGTNRSIIPGQNIVGFNCMEGSGIWYLFYGGIVLGKGVPSIDMIMQGAGLKRAGIDISQGEINLKADKVNFLLPDGNTNPNVSIDPSTGTFKAVNGIFEGSLFYHKVVVCDAGNPEVGYRLYTSTSTLEGDIFSVDSATYGIAMLMLPYPDDCVGASVKIIRRNDCRVNLYLKDYYNAHESSGQGNVPLNAFYCLQDFELAASGGTVTLEQHDLSWDTYSSVELVATLNPVSPNWTPTEKNYVWMVVDVK